MGFGCKAICCDKYTFCSTLFVCICQIWGIGVAAPGENKSALWVRILTVSYMYSIPVWCFGQAPKLAVALGVRIQILDGML